MRRVVLLAVSAALLLAPGARGSTFPACSPFTPPPPPMEGTPGFVFVGQPDPCPPRGRMQEDFQVTTDFGDGTAAETPFGRGDYYWVAGTYHAYRRAGTYQVVATATDRETGEQIVIRNSIPVRNAPLTALRTQRPTFSTRRTVSRTVARFVDGNRLATADDHTATISWGDGTRSAGTVIKAGHQGFRVVGRHRYRTDRRHRITVAVSDDLKATLRLRTTA